jgi:heme/copper-type cytochrome/quinol oxidase subunit 2
MRPKVALSRLAFAAALALAAAALWAVGAGAQCALCRTALQDSGETAARAMNLGILVLLVPPVAIFCTIFVVAYRKGKGSSQ